MIYAYVVCGFVSLFFAGMAWETNKKRNASSRIVSAVVAAIIWPVVLPVAIGMTVAESLTRDKYEHEAEVDGLKETALYWEAIAESYGNKLTSSEDLANE